MKFGLIAVLGFCLFATSSAQANNALLQRLINLLRNQLGNNNNNNNAGNNNNNPNIIIIRNRRRNNGGLPGNIGNLLPFLLLGQQPNQGILPQVLPVAQNNAGPRIQPLILQLPKQQAAAANPCQPAGCAPPKPVVKNIPLNLLLNVKATQPQPACQCVQAAPCCQAPTPAPCCPQHHVRAAFPRKQIRAPVVQQQQLQPQAQCFDIHTECPGWVIRDQLTIGQNCERSTFMQTKCAKSCGLC